MSNIERVTTEKVLPEEVVQDTALRPQRLNDFVGQKLVKEQISLLIEAATQRQTPVDHVLLFGPPGLGKTTLAQIIAAELGVSVRTTSGPAIEHQGMLASMLTGLETRDVLFIDEIHRLPRIVEEALYPAMEDFAFDWVAGKGAGAQALRLDLNPFTIVGATTRAGALGGPLRDRFGVMLRLEYYEIDDIVSIIHRSASLLGAVITTEGAYRLGSRSRGTPRIANRLLRRARDFAEVRANGVIDQTVVDGALALLQIDEHGLDDMDRRVLRYLCVTMRGRPVGLNSLAVSVQEESETIEDVVEPYLIRLGLIARTTRGRIATADAFAYLGMSQPVVPLEQAVLHIDNRTDGEVAAGDDADDGDV